MAHKIYSILKIQKRKGNGWEELELPMAAAGEETEVEHLTVKALTFGEIDGDFESKRHVRSGMTEV